MMRFIRVTGWARAVTVFLYDPVYSKVTADLFFTYSRETFPLNYVPPYDTTQLTQWIGVFVYVTLSKCIYTYNSDRHTSPFSFVLGSCVLVIKKKN